MKMILALVKSFSVSTMVELEFVYYTLLRVDHVSANVKKKTLQQEEAG